MGVCERSGDVKEMRDVGVERWGGEEDDEGKVGESSGGNN